MSTRPTHRVTFTIPDTREQPSARSLEIAELFGIAVGGAHHAVLRDVEVPVSGLVFITGYSGSGKSTLLRCLGEQKPLAQPMATGDLPNHGAVVDMFPGSVPATVHWLARFGLGEPRLLATTPSHLSEGQKQRLVLARLLWDRPTCIAVDEFLSNLDRTTAFMVAFNVQKVCREHGVTAYFATAHDDLCMPLQPDAIVRMDFDGHGAIEEGPGSAAFAAWLDQHLEESEGTVADFDELAMYHYRECDDRWIDWDNLVVEVRRVQFRGQTVAVKVFARPFPRALEAIPLLNEINQRILLQERVIVHPAFRGIALNRRMNPTRSRAEVVFAQSALGMHFPYNLKAGFTACAHPAERPSPSQDALRALVLRLTDRPINIHDAADILSLWERLGTDDRAEVRSSVTLALSEWLLRYVTFLAAQVDRTVSERETLYLNTLFQRAAQGADAESLAKLIESAMPFPMAGFVKELHHV